MNSNLRYELRFWLIAFVVFFAALYLLRGVLLPFVAGMAVAYLLDPVCDRLEKMGLSRTMATAALTAAFIVIATGTILLLVPLLAGQLAGLLSRVPDLIELLRGRIEELLAVAQARLDPELTVRLQEVAAEAGKKLLGLTTTVLGQAISQGAALLNLFSLIVITPVVAFYLLRDWDSMVERVDGWLPKHMAATIREQVGEVNRMLAGFVRGQTTVCTVLAIFYAAALTVAGLDFGLVIGLIAGLLSFVPFVGSAVGFVASVGMAWVQFDDWTRIAIVAAVFFVGQALEGNLLTPKLVGGRIGLHPVWVIFALLAGGLLFGFVGVLLAVPVAAVVGVLVRFLLKRYLESVFYLGGAPSAEGAEKDGGA